MTVIINGDTGITSPADSLSGNLNFTGTGNRITGDFSNATIANRVMFQTSTVNGNTNISAIPNGTGTVTNIYAFNSSNPSNSSYVALSAVASTDVRINSSYLGTGTYLPMTFYTGGTESLRLSKDYKTVILSGGSTSANGTGITFPATQSASSDANTLDDYEEGTFTPTISFATQGTMSATYAAQSGKYTKIGNLVYVQIFIQLTAFSKGTASGTLKVKGLPFSCNGTNDTMISWGIYDTPMPTTAGQFPVSSVDGGGETSISLMYQSSNNTSNPSWPDPDSNSQYKLSGCYPTTT